MSIARKLAISIVAFVVLIAVTAGIAAVQIERVGSVADRIGERELPAVRDSGAMRAEVIDVRNRETPLLVFR